MRLSIQFAIFISLFLTLTFILHYYILFHLAYMFGIPHDLWFWIIYLIASLSFMLSMGLQMRTSNLAVRIFYIISAIWFGVLFLILFTLIGYDIARIFINIDPNQAGIAIVSFIGIVSIFSAVNAYFVRIRQIKLPGNGLGNGLKIVQLSDLHIGPVHSTGFLKKIVEKTNELDPDLVLITGDLADGTTIYSESTFAPIDNIKAPVYFTTGNHEYYGGLDQILALIDKTKAKILRNEKVEVNGVEIIGLDDSRDRHAIMQKIERLKPNPNKYTILMHHRPVGLENAQKLGVNLMLAGHTHSGQFFPMTIFAKLVWKRFKGLYQYKDTYLYSSSGTGTWGPPLRLGSSSEITLLKLSNN